MYYFSYSKLLRPAHVIFQLLPIHNNLSLLLLCIRLIVHQFMNSIDCIGLYCYRRYRVWNIKLLMGFRMYPRFTCSSAGVSYISIDCICLQPNTKISIFTKIIWICMISSAAKCLLTLFLLARSFYFLVLRLCIVIRFPHFLFCLLSANRRIHVKFLSPFSFRNTSLWFW